MDTYPSHPTTAILPIDTPKIGELKAERNKKGEDRSNRRGRRVQARYVRRGAPATREKNQKQIKSGYAQKASEVKPGRGAPAPQGKKSKTNKKGLCTKGQ